MIAKDYAKIDTSPKPTRCERVLNRLAELTAALGFAFLIYTAAVVCFSL